MTVASLTHPRPPKYELAHSLVPESRNPSTSSKIYHYLGARVALVAISLLYLAEAVTRSVGVCIAYIGYLITLGYWEQAKCSSLNQIQKGAHAGSVGLCCLRFIPSVKESASYQSIQSSLAQRSARLEGPLNPQTGSHRVRKGTELIAIKLQNQLDLAQAQARQESENADFIYHQAPAHFEGHSQSEQIAGYEVGVCHFIGRRAEMEDEHLITSFSLNVNGTVHPVQLLGIFDGHGGKDASIYVRDHLQRNLHETLDEFCANGLTDEAIWNALKITFVKLNENFKKAKSGTTATVAMILDGKIWTANVGDSRTILDSGIQLSEDAKPKNPRYMKGIVKRGGKVIGKRVNGYLAVARAVGDHNVCGVNARPKITCVPLSSLPTGGHLILACDGIYDVATTHQIASAVSNHSHQPAVELAKNIVYSAYQANSRDNLSALVVTL